MRNRERRVQWWNSFVVVFIRDSHLFFEIFFSDRFSCRIWMSKKRRIRFCRLWSDRRAPQPLQQTPSPHTTTFSTNNNQISCTSQTPQGQTFDFPSQPSPPKLPLPRPRASSCLQISMSSLPSSCVLSLAIILSLMPII